YDLGELAPRSQVARPEVYARAWLSRPAAVVPGHDVEVGGGLHVLVERVARRLVSEVRSGRGIDGHAVCQHEYLHHLRACGVVVGAEGAVSIPGDGPSAVQPAHPWIEVVGLVHVCEGYSAGCWRGGGGWSCTAPERHVIH